MIDDVVSELQLAKVNHILHPVFPRGWAVRMHVDPALKVRLQFRRPGERPASCALVRAIVVVAAAAGVSAVLVPAIGSRCYLHQNVVTLPLLQAVHTYLHRREHASAIKRGGNP